MAEVQTDTTVSIKKENKHYFILIVCHLAFNSFILSLFNMVFKT